jgi:long-chain acyl-CoA synthetase
LKSAPDWHKHYPPGLAREYTPPAVPVWSFVQRNATKRPDAPALFFNDLVVTWGELWHRIEIAASILRSRGFARGKRSDRVLLALPNSPEFVIQYYATLRADMIAVAVSPGLKTDELEPIIQSVEPKAAFVHSDTAVEFESARVRARIREPRDYYLQAGQDFEPVDGGIDLLAAILGPPDDAVQRVFEDVAVLQFTSGTTGTGKAAMLSHRNLVANAEQNNHWFQWTEQDVILGALPLYHTWGQSSVLNAAVVAGAPIALIETFNARQVLEAIRRHKVTVAYGSGTMFLRLLESAGDEAPEYFRSLRYVKAGAMLIDASLNRRWAEMVPDVPMINGYGLTEASPEVSNNPPARVKPGTVGLPLPGTDIRLCMTDEPEREVEAGKQGEIQVRGPQVMLGYWSEIEATRDSVLPGGWLRTGDIGEFDEDGYLRIVDRLKDLVKFRGYSVFPSEIEAVLLKHPAVKEACVVGIPDAQDGEVPVAYLVLHPGAPLDVSDMPEFIEPHLADFKRPRRFHIVHDIPRNHVGKALKRVLREMPEPGRG